MRIKSPVMLAACIALVGALPAAAQTLDRIKEARHIRLGYIADARPFTHRNQDGTADGYGIALCQAIVEHLKEQLALPTLTPDWVPVTVDYRTSEVKRGNLDLLCTPTAVSLGNRKDVAYSIPIFAGGNRAVLRNDAPEALRHTLAGVRPDKPVWRGSPAARVLEGKTYAVVAGSSTQTWLEERRSTFQIDAKVKPVPDYRTGLQLLLDRKVDVFFGDRALVLGAMDANARDKLVVIERLFTNEVAGLALERGDEDFRLAVDTALSRLYGSKEFPALYAKWIGPFDDNTRAFFQWNRLGQ